MPRRPRSRRSRSRGLQPPRVPEAAAQAALGSALAAQRRNPSTPAASERPARQVERDAPFVRGELIRIGIVSAVCMSLLVALVAIDRLG